MAKRKEQTKEQIYDNQISPLMAQIIAICKEHKIAMLADFSLDVENGLKCTTALLADDFEPTPNMLEAVNLLYQKQRSPLMVTTRDGDGKVTSMTAIL